MFKEKDIVFFEKEYTRDDLPFIVDKNTSAIIIKISDNAEILTEDNVILTAPLNVLKPLTLLEGNVYKDYLKYFVKDNKMKIITSLCYNIPKEIYDKTPMSKITKFTNDVYEDKIKIFMTNAQSVFSWIDSYKLVGINTDSYMEIDINETYSYDLQLANEITFFKKILLGIKRDIENYFEMSSSWSEVTKTNNVSVKKEIKTINLYNLKKESINKQQIIDEISNAIESIENLSINDNLSIEINITKKDM